MVTYPYRVVTPVIVLLFIQTIFFSQITPLYAQECGEILHIGDVGKAAVIDLPLHDTPGGRLISTLTLNTPFLILAEPVCEDGVAWWYIEKHGADTPHGWIPESVGGVPQVNIRFPANTSFETRIVLSEAAPILDAQRQVKFDMGAGGGGEFCPNQISRSWYHFGETIGSQFSPLGDTEHFSPGENVQITIYRPNGTIYLEEESQALESGGSLGCKAGTVIIPYIDFKVTEPAGEWLINMEGASGTTASYSVFLTPNIEPMIKAICDGPTRTLVLDGFQPGETLKIEFVSQSSEYIYIEADPLIQLADTLHSWSVKTDDLGQLWMTVDDGIDTDETIILVEDNSGYIWGDGLETKNQFDNISFRACEDQEVKPNAALAVQPESQRIIARAPLNREMARQYRSVWDTLQFRDMLSPGIQEYQLTIDSDEALLLSFTWCADNTNRLQQILEPLIFSIQIDEIAIPSSSLLQTDSSTCRIWDTVLSGWEAGNDVVLSLSYTLEADIFDGVAEYAAGDYLHKIAVKVNE